MKLNTEITMLIYPNNSHVLIQCIELDESYSNIIKQYSAFIPINIIKEAVIVEKGTIKNSSDDRLIDKKVYLLSYYKNLKIINHYFIGEHNNVIELINNVDFNIIQDDRIN